MFTRTTVSCYAKDKNIKQQLQQPQRVDLYQHYNLFQINIFI